MDHEASRMMEVAALGRPFTLGMLYDCRQDSLVPGMTLWDRDDLGKNAGVRSNPATEFEIVASESIEDKSSALNVEASLKASFLGGLVEVEGSAKYLNDQKTSKHQARVTLKYKTTTKFQELSMNHLGRGNVKHPYVFHKGIATHVVTGILYGAQAFFVFDREVSGKETHRDIQGKLQVMINKIPSLAIGGEGSLKMEEKDKVVVDKFSCKFHGDFSLEKNPVTFQDAVEVYQSLPKLLGADGEKAVPVKVWLLPLVNLDFSAAKLVREISVRLVQETQSVLEDFNDLEMRCNDALRTTTAQQFPQISKKIKAFKEMCSEFRMDFQRNLAMKLPSIRGGGEEEAVLAGILKRRHSSPFNSEDLNKWMDCKEREICTLKSFTNMMKNNKIVPSQSLHEEILNAEHVVCFVFTSLGGSEQYLSALSHHLREPDNSQNPKTYDIEKEQWYLSKEAANDMRHKTKLFRDFAEANNQKQNVKFLTLGLTNDMHKGSSIYLYKDGFSVSENFQPPSKPEAVTISDINHSSVTLNVSPPRFGADTVTSYTVDYCIYGDDLWKRVTTSIPGEVTVSGLRLDTEYVFRYRAETPAGVGPQSDVSGSFKTLPSCPPGKPCVEANSSEISVSWEKPAELGPDVHVLSYVVEFAKTENGLKEENLAWKQVMSGAGKSVISGLQSETEYTVRVRCDCGVAGSSKESENVSISTTKREFTRLAEYLKDISMRINSEVPSCYKLPLEEDDIDMNGCRLFNFGKESLRQNRTIMLLGATGAGKSTLINGMINYIIGVEWKDDFRFKVVDEGHSKSQAESQTSDVTVYKLNHQEGFQIPFSLTIVDTPGFGDTRGVERDKEIMEQIRRLFSSADGVSEIDAVCFVTQAPLARLTATQRYVFDSLFSIFGKDVAENIEMLVTFADGKQPPVLEAITVSGVPCPKNDLGLPVHFKFNNSALFADSRCSHAVTCDDEFEDDDENFDEMFWNMGYRSMEKFFIALAQMTTKSLLMTQEVLRERKQLETAIEGLQPQVKAGLAKLEEIKSTKEKIKEHEAVMVSNKDFEIEVDIIKPVQEMLKQKGVYVTNCQQCSMTCHYPCTRAKDKDKRGCTSINKRGKCTVCPGKCVWSVHFNQEYRWEYVKVKEKKTLQELKEKYEEATKEKLTVQQLIKRQEKEIVELQDTVVALLDQLAASITRLQEIALRPNPLTTPECIDMMIDRERSEAKEGYQARVQSLEEMKERANIISKVTRRDTLTKTEERKGKKGRMKRFLNYFGL